jgi:hypothetical protein
MSRRGGIRALMLCERCVYNCLRLSICLIRIRLQQSTVERAIKILSRYDTHS